MTNSVPVAVGNDLPYLPGDLSFARAHQILSHDEYVLLSLFYNLSGKFIYENKNSQLKLQTDKLVKMIYYKRDLLRM